MNEQTVVKKKRNSPPRGGWRREKVRRFIADEKLKAVRLRLEEGFSLADVCAEIGVTQSGLSRWIRQYRALGEAGLQSGTPGTQQARLPAPITDKIIELKQAHPMTLGKIERFWATIWPEFLARAQFDSFEAARERIKLWIEYYNHKRPHQGIEGLCPADRFFEIQTQLRRTIERGIQENLLELALRGKPQAPFYMVGRMDGQSVVLRAENGQLKLSVSDQQNNEQELTYDLHQNNDQRKENGTEKTQPSTPSQCPGQSPGGAGGVDGTVQAGGSLPPVEHQLDHLQPLAAAGDGGDAAGAGELRQPDQGRGLEPAPAGVVATASAGGDGDQNHQPLCGVVKSTPCMAAIFIWIRPIRIGCCPLPSSRIARNSPARCIPNCWRNCKS